VYINFILQIQVDNLPFHTQDTKTIYIQERKEIEMKLKREITKTPFAKWYEVAKAAKENERGLSLVEVIIVIAIIAMVTAMVGPKAIEAMGKSKSNSLKDEFSTAVSAFSSMSAAGNSPVHAVKVDVADGAGNQIMTDYVLEIAPSAAFGTTTESEVFARSVDGKKPLTLTYGLNTITVDSETNYTGTVRHSGNLNKTALAFKTAVSAPSLSAQGTTGIAPIFSLNETKLLEDFIISENGLDWAEFKDYLASDVDVLAVVFGGPNTNKNTSYLPYEATTTYLSETNSTPVISLTVVDTDTLAASSSGSSLSTLTNQSTGTLYQVTGIMSRADFVALATQANSPLAKSGGTIDASTAEKMYTKIETGFLVGNPVYVPHREKDSIKSTASDLKHGYYRP
jgi:prepilin-type N-terminal cleavage/methylation domain-containing protein